MTIPSSLVPSSLADAGGAQSSTRGPAAAAGAPDRDRILAALDRVIDPISGRGLVAAGLVEGLVVAPGRAGFMLEVTAQDARLYVPVRDAAEAALLTVPGVDAAQVVMTSEGGAEPRQAAGTVRLRKTADLPAEARAAPPPRSAPSHANPHGSPTNPQPIAHVRHVIAVASGKGGVGKSTVAVNLAVALSQLGLRTGLLDADVYGPSIPRMLGLNAEPEVGPDKKLIPLRAWGLKTVSIGFLVNEGSPMIWRGPMASSAVTQLLNDVDWGSADEPLDVLVLDMPPGTGDIQLTLAQKVKLSGAIIVSTPQEVALIDVRRGVSMFEKTNIAILGVVENMAYFTNPSTGEPIEIFGRGGARATAQQVGAPFLGEIPIDIALRQACDAGRPITAIAPQSPAGQVFMDIARQVRAKLEAI